MISPSSPPKKSMPKSLVPSPLTISNQVRSSLPLDYVSILYRSNSGGDLNSPKADTTRHQSEMQSSADKGGMGLGGPRLGDIPPMSPMFPHKKPYSDAQPEPVISEAVRTMSAVPTLFKKRASSMPTSPGERAIQQPSIPVYNIHILFDL